MLKHLDVNVGDVPEVVAACVLHNICEHHGEFSAEWLGVESQGSECGSVATSTSQPQDSAVSIRDALTSHFVSN